MIRLRRFSLFKFDPYLLIYTRGYVLKLLLKCRFTGFRIYITDSVHFARSQERGHHTFTCGVAMVFTRSWGFSLLQKYERCDDVHVQE